MLNNIIDLILKKWISPILMTEAESNFKGGLLKTSKTKTQWFWLHSSSPARFDIDFKYKIIFNKEAIEKDFVLPDGTVDWEGFYQDVIKKNFSERYVWIKAKYITVPGFKVDGVTYNSEATDKTLNPKRNLLYNFKHTVTLEAIDKNKVYKKDEIAKAAQEFANKFEKVAYQNTPYYKITK